MDKIPVLRRRLRATSTGTTAVMDFDPVPLGTVWQLLRVAVRNQVSANSAVEIGVVEADEFHALVSIATTTANAFVTAVCEVPVREGEVVRARWYSIVANDVLDVHLTGMVVLPRPFVERFATPTVAVAVPA